MSDLLNLKWGGLLSTVEVQWHFKDTLAHLVPVILLFGCQYQMVFSLLGVGWTLVYSRSQMRHISIKFVKIWRAVTSVLLGWTSMLGLLHGIWGSRRSNVNKVEEEQIKTNLATREAFPNYTYCVFLMTKKERKKTMWKQCNHISLTWGAQQSQHVVFNIQYLKDIAVNQRKYAWTGIT